MNDYKVFYDDARVGHYFVFGDEVRNSAFRRDDEDYSEDQKQLGSHVLFDGISLKIFINRHGDLDPLGNSAYGREAISAQQSERAAGGI